MVIDLRSDTVTRPSMEMRQAVLEAELGDDVIGSDPTLERLQFLAAEVTGQEEALFVASGTMGNLVALVTHCQAGDEVILGQHSHIIEHEVGGIARFAHSMARALPDPGGRIDLADLCSAVRDQSDIHHPRTRLICLENSHEASGGTPLSVGYTEAIRELADKHGLALHLDGARVFNSAAALGVSVRELCQPADSVTFCLSKGLCCPVGSLLCGSRDFISRARKVRKALGGGMRQLGFLAAPGLWALTHLTQRLSEDHERARALAEGIAQLPGIELDPTEVRTNIVYLTVSSMPALSLQHQLAEAGIACFAMGRRVRLVTHRDINDEDIRITIEAFRRILTQESPG